MKMTIEIEKLKRVKTYAAEHGLTVQAIYKRVMRGYLESVEIDGMTFIITD